MAASAASKIGTVVKEGAVFEKVAGVYESATSKIEAISQKMAGLNKKMETLQHSEEQLAKSAVKHMGMPESAGFENLKPVRLEKSPVSDAFFEKVEHAKSRLEGWVGDHLERQGIEIHTVDKLENVFGARSARTPACFNPNDILSADGTEVLVKKGIYIAEHVWHDGNWQKNVDVLFQLHHEVGHAMCETLKTDWLSNETAFGKLFSQCWKDADKANPTAIVLERLGTKEARCNEVFADLWSHLRFTPHGTNDYSRDMLKLFRPCFEYMQTKGEEWKAAAALSQKKL
jgi:hypothetical protein